MLKTSYEDAKTAGKLQAFCGGRGKVMCKKTVFKVGVIVGVAAAVCAGIVLATRFDAVKDAVKGVSGAKADEVDAEELRAKIEAARQRIAAEMEKENA